MEHEIEERWVIIVALQHRPDLRDRVSGNPLAEALV
jgi:hypothetical protein